MSLSGCHLSPQHDVITAFIYLPQQNYPIHSANWMFLTPTWGFTSWFLHRPLCKFSNLWTWFCFYSIVWHISLFDLKAFSASESSSRPALVKNSTLFHSGSKLITQLQLRLIFFYIICMIVSVDCSSLNHLAVSFTVKNVEELFSAIKGQTRCSLIKLVYQDGKMRRSCTVLFSL